MLPELDGPSAVSDVAALTVAAAATLALLARGRRQAPGVSLGGSGGGQRGWAGVGGGVAGVSALARWATGVAGASRRTAHPSHHAPPTLPLLQPNAPCGRCKGTGSQECQLCYGRGSTPLPGFINTADPANRRLCVRCAGSCSHACNVCGGAGGGAAWAAEARARAAAARRPRLPAAHNADGLDDF